MSGTVQRGANSKPSAGYCGITVRVIRFIALIFVSMKARLNVMAWSFFGLALVATGMAQNRSDLAPKRIVGMEYPWFARMGALQGTVRIQATVNADGSLENVRVISGPGPLATPTKETFARWRFAGCPSGTGHCTVTFVFNFSLEGKCEISHCPTEFQVDFPDQVKVASKTFDSVIADRTGKTGGGTSRANH